MKFLIAVPDLQALLKNVGMSRPKKTDTFILSACASRVFVEFRGIVAGIEMLVLSDGAVELPAHNFPTLIKTYKGTQFLNFDGGANGLKIQNLTTPVISWNPQPEPPAYFQLFPPTFSTESLVNQKRLQSEECGDGFHDPGSSCTNTNDISDSAKRKRGFERRLKQKVAIHLAAVCRKALRRHDLSPFDIHRLACFLWACEHLTEGQKKVSGNMSFYEQNGSEQIGQVVSIGEGGVQLWGSEILDCGDHPSTRIYFHDATSVQLEVELEYFYTWLRDLSAAAADPNVELCLECYHPDTLDFLSE